MYFPKEVDNIVKLHTLAIADDSAAFFSYGNKYRARAISQKNFPLLCTIYEKFAVYYFTQDNVSIAFKYFDSAVIVIEREKLPEYNYYVICHNRAVMKYTSEDYYGALKDYKRSEELMLKYQVGNVGNLYNNIATLYLIAHDVENAKKYIYKAMPFVKLNKSQDSYVKLLKSLGSVYIAEKQFKIGDSILNLAINLSKKNNLKIDLAESLYDYANSLRAQEKTEETKPVFEELVKLTRELKDDNFILQVTLELAKVNLIMGNKSEAKKNLLDAEKINPSSSMQALEKLDVYRNSALLYHNLGFFEKAAESYKKYLDLYDLGEAKNEVGKLKELSYDYEKKQDSLGVAREKEIIELENLREQDKADHKLRQQQIILGVSLVGLIGIIVFALFLIKANRNKEKANVEILNQKKLITEKNKEITDSITYAKRIQHSLLPVAEFIEILLPKYFLLYKPKDIVSGDFFWIKKINSNEVFVAIADCTGHGVPGAMMSALSIQNLNELSRQTHSPSELLALLNADLKNTLNQDQEGFSKDGLDICLCKLNTKEKTVTFSGANRSLLVFNKKGLKKEIKATKAGIAGHTSLDQVYEENELTLETDDLVVLSTDGFADQFGGEQNKKITTKRFKEWLASIFDSENKEQELEKKFMNWKNTNDQIDDVCVLGFKI